MPKSNKYNKSYGLSNPLQNIFPEPIVAQRVPATSDTGYRLGQLWVDQTTGQIYGLASVASASATWSILGPGASDVDTLTGDSGGALSPTGGNMNLLGGTNITTVGAGSTVTFNLDAAISLSTSVTSPIYTTSAADMNINSAASQDILMQMGDAAGAQKISFEDSASAEVGSLDSNGNLTTLSYATSAATAGMTLSGSDIDADGSDSNISITVSPKGTGDFIVDVGDIQDTAGDIIATRSSAGADVTVEATNSDNTDPASRGGFEAAVGGTSAGDPYVNFLISGGQSFTMGIDNSSTNDDFVISDAAALGTNDRLVIDGSTGDTSVTGNLILSSVATQLQMNGGAVTDFIGTATLSSGTITVANTNISATDRIFIQRQDINGSSALGMFTYSISASTSFTITSVQPGTPGSTETNDASIVMYWIVRQN